MLDRTMYSWLRCRWGATSVLLVLSLASAPVRASILEALAAVEASAPATLLDAFDSFSKFEYEYECPDSKRQLAVPIEPLYGAVRHPAAITCNREGTAVTDMSLITSLKHLVLSSNPRDAAPTHQRFLFDLGASHWNDLSQSALIGLYSKRGIFFDRHLMWEAENNSGADVMKDVPRSEHHSYQYFNIPAVADINDPGNPLNIVLRITKPHDFVALKLDIDHAPTEASFIQQILDNPELSSRVDELFWEAHFNVPPLIKCCWREGADLSMGFSKSHHLSTVGTVAAASAKPDSDKPEVQLRWAITPWAQRKEFCLPGCCLDMLMAVLSGGPGTMTQRVASMSRHVASGIQCARMMPGHRGMTQGLAGMMRAITLVVRRSHVALLRWGFKSHPAKKPNLRLEGVAMCKGSSRLVSIPSMAQRMADTGSSAQIVEPDSNDAQEVQEPVLGGLFGVLFAVPRLASALLAHCQPSLRVDHRPRQQGVAGIFLPIPELLHVSTRVHLLPRLHVHSGRLLVCQPCAMYMGVTQLPAEQVRSLLDIASVTLFLIALDCQYFAVPDSQLHYNQEFPDVCESYISHGSSFNTEAVSLCFFVSPYFTTYTLYFTCCPWLPAAVDCWGMPHIIHASVAAIAVGLFVVLATIFTAAEVELNPVSRNLLGMPHS
ncbi:uncharacterized protein HaLaN_25561, partial [Haematococcus lacustris]